MSTTITTSGAPASPVTAPANHPSVRSALQNLRLDPLDVVHPGEHTYPLGEGIRAVALRRVHQDVDPL